MPLLGAALVASAVLRGHGDARRAMVATLAGGLVNAVFDPILIFGLGLELRGAAIASVLARIAIFVAALWPAIRVYDGFARPRLDTIRRDFRQVFAIAAPAMLTNVATPFGNAIVTREVAQFGTDAVAGLAIVARLTPVAFAVVFALSGAIGPIIGQNAGAGMPDRVRGAFAAGLRFVTAYVVGVTLILFLLRGAIADIFGAEGLTRELVFLFCGFLALGFIFNGAIFVCNATFNNLGRPVYSTAVNWGRHTLGTWPLAVAGGAVGGAGGVLIGQALGGVVFAGLAVWLARRVMATADAAVPGRREPFSAQSRLHVVASRRH
jgi:Na+-driven multidrug efflux pump